MEHFQTRCGTAVPFKTPTEVYIQTLRLRRDSANRKNCLAKIVKQRKQYKVAQRKTARNSDRVCECIQTNRVEPASDVTNRINLIKLDNSCVHTLQAFSTAGKAERRNFPSRMANNPANPLVQFNLNLNLQFSQTPAADDGG